MALLANIRLGWKSLTGTNTLASEQRLWQKFQTIEAQKRYVFVVVDNFYTSLIFAGNSIGSSLSGKH